MEQKEIMKEFDELYGMMATSGNPKYMHIFGETMKCMMSDLATVKPELAQGYVDKLSAIKWKNYLTKKEASFIIAKMNPSARWDAQEWLDCMENASLPMEEKPYYNDYALYVAMNQVVSDHGDTISEFLKADAESNPKKLTEAAYKLAIDLLKDKDGVYNIREYFLK